MDKSNINDMTSGNILKQLIIFTLPIFFGNVLQQVYSLVDTIIVGKYLGKDPLAAVGATGNIVFFMFSLLIGLTGGIAIVIAQYVGANDYNTVKAAFANSIYAMCVMTGILTLAGYFLARPMLELLNTPDNVIDMAEIYLKIIFLGTISTAVYNYISSILRALGDSVTPLIFLAISSVLNIVLDVVLITKAGMGVEGAAYATVFSQLVSAIMCVAFALYRKEILRIKRANMQLNMPLIKKMMLVGLPAGIQSGLISISVMVMQSVINIYGSTVMAAYSSAIKIEQLAMQAGNSIGMAAGNFTGQNVGAGNYDRVKKGVSISVKMIIGACVILSPLIFIFAKDLMGLFVSSTEADYMSVINVGSTYLRIMTFFLAFVGILQLWQNVLRSAGDVSMTMIMGLSEVITRVILAYAMSALLGCTGVWWATPLTWVAAMMVGTVRYISGKWRSKALVD